jgi:hypothetical protein
MLDAVPYPSAYESDHVRDVLEAVRRPRMRNPKIAKIGRLRSQAHSIRVIAAEVKR